MYNVCNFLKCCLSCDINSMEYDGMFSDGKQVHYKFICTTCGTCALSSHFIGVLIPMGKIKQTKGGVNASTETQ